MKKLLFVLTVIAVAATMTVGAYAYHGQGMRDGRGNTMSGMHHGMMNQDGMNMRGGMHGMMGGQQQSPCGNVCPYQTGANVAGQPGTALQMIAEDKAKVAAEEYLAKYLTGYAVEKIEKDAWRPLYIVTIKGANDVKQQMMIHGISGQVMHVSPMTVQQ